MVEPPCRRGWNDQEVRALRMELLQVRDRRLTIRRMVACVDAAGLREVLGV